jgi:hypothetical protein
VHVTEAFPVRPCAVAVMVAVADPVPQVKLQTTEVVFWPLLLGAMQPFVVVH